MGIKLDMGFSHAIAKAVLEDDKNNETALNELALPKNKAYVDNKI